MSQTIALEDPPISVALHRTRAARGFSLSVSRLDGRARLTMPAGCGDAEARAFIDQHQDWLRGAVDRAPDVVALEIGAVVPFRGRAVRIGDAGSSPGRRGAVRLSPDGDRILVAAPAGRAAASLVVAWLREAARARLLERATAHAHALGAEFSQIAIRDTRSRWGSCSSRGALSFSWRLILAPDSVSDYVAAHEVAHLREMNHSPKFWAVVERLYPDWRRQRDWLRRHGATLHRYQAGARDASKSA